MAVYKRPGVYISESVLPNTVEVEDTPSLSAFLGQFEKGPTDNVTLVTSWSEFVRTFGSLNASYPATFAAYAFYLNGGQNLVINRVTASGAAAASRTLVDRAGTAQDTLVVTAANPGAWGNDIYVSVSDNASDGTRFDLAVYYGGSTSDKVVEEYVGCSMDPSDSRYVVSFVSQPSRYITVTDSNSTTTSPSDRPKVLAASAGRLGSGTGTVVAGSNGSGTPDYAAGLSKFDTVPFPMDLNVPGLSDKTILDNVIEWAHNRGDVFVVVDTAAGNSASDTTTFATELDSAVKATTVGLSGTSSAAIYYPWLTIPDPLASVSGQTRTIAPGGAVLGMIARSDAIQGPEKAPAGIATPLRNVVAPEKTLTASDLDTLNAHSVPVNAIRSVPGAGVCVMGAKTLKPGAADRYVNVRRTLIYLKSEMDQRLQFAQFQNNDTELWSQITNVLRSFLTQFWQSGGLKGNAPQDAFWIVCDSSNNTSASIQNGEVRVSVGVALQYPAEFVVINLSQITGA